MAETAMQPVQADAVDRRSGPRRVCRLRVDLRLADGRGIAAVSLDIAQDGMALLLPCALPPGTDCTIGFSLYAGGAIRRIEADARALNSIFMSHDVRVGFSFTQIGADSRRMLAEFVAHGGR